MEIKKTEGKEYRPIKITSEEDGREVARAFLYIIHNDLHKEPEIYLK